MALTESLNMDFLGNFKKEVRPENISLIYDVDSDFSFDFVVDFDGSDTYLNVCLLINDQEDGLIQHSVCEIGKELSFRLARSIAISTEKSAELYMIAESISGEISFWLKQNKIDLSVPFMNDGHLNPQILNGIVRFGYKDYRNWSESIKRQISH